MLSVSSKPERLLHITDRSTISIETRYGGVDESILSAGCRAVTLSAEFGAKPKRNPSVG